MKTGLNFKSDLKIANAAGMDAANRAMRAAGRSAWNDDDAALACDTCSTLLRSWGWDFVA